MTGKRSPYRRWWPFGLLCGVLLLRWFAADAVPAVGPSLWSLAVGSFTAWLIATLLALRAEGRAPGKHEALQSVLAGVCLCTGPLLQGLSASVLAEPASITISMALIPVVVAVARPAFHRGEGAELAGRLWPGIAAIAGLLLLLPEPGLEDWHRNLAWLMMPVGTGVGAVWLRTAGGAAIWKASFALGACWVLFSCAAVLRHTSYGHVTLLASIFEAIIFGLSVLALLRVGATRWASQYVLVPLLVVLESLMTARPALDVRAIAGVLLLAVASLFLLLPPRVEHEGEALP
ncbi:MAG: hypothetical protein PW735_05520 [Acidobacteriaceae bacterium]|nr:hypothetical protein [Acidobacteriaceae bacterium]